ncbi:MAG: hypothetical protein AAF519_04925 [Bacteroidota bacterium]
MRKFFALTFFSFIILNDSESQVQIRDGALQIFANNGDRVEQIFAPVPDQPHGKTLLLDHFQNGEMQLLNGHIISEIQINYDLLSKQIIVKTDTGDIVISSIFVKNFSIKSPLKSYYFEKTSYGSHIEKIYAGKQYSLYANHSIKVIKAKYNQALDLGDKQDKHVKKVNYHFSCPDNKHLEIPRKKRDFVKLFDEKDQALLDQYFSTNLYKPKDAKSLKNIFEYLSK